MFRLLGSIPQKVALALSGGIDSMVALHFLLQGRRDVTVVHVNHQTEYGNEAEKFVREQCKKYELDLYLRHVEGTNVDSNREETWRNMRYDVFNDYLNNHHRKLITAHHLDDCLETWLFSTLNGKPKTIPYERGNIIRPFLLVSKEQIEDYADEHDIECIEDASNYDCTYMRNHIRHNLIPETLIVNPGLHKTVAKIVQERYNRLYGY